MAFMMPIVKNDYNIYASRGGTPQTSRGSSLSSSPSGVSFMNSPRHSQTPAFTSVPKSESQNSLNNFHSKLLMKLKRAFRSKDDDSQRADSSGSSTVSVR